MTTQAIPTQYRQGDVFFQEVEALPEGAVEQKQEGRLVIKHGTATGHNHGFDGKAVLFTAGDRRFVKTEEGAALTHDEHNTIDFKPAVYEVKEQREWTPTEFRTVVD